MQRDPKATQALDKEVSDIVKRKSCSSDKSQPRSSRNIQNYSPLFTKKPKKNTSMSPHKNWSIKKNREIEFDHIKEAQEEQEEEDSDLTS